MNLNNDTSAVRRAWAWLRNGVRSGIALLLLSALSCTLSSAFAQTADLSIGAPTLGTIVANPNGSWTIPVTYTVTNVGSVTTPAGWYDVGYLSTDGVLDNSDSSTGTLNYRSTTLAAGASYTVTASFTTTTTTTPGTYTLFVKADGHNTTYTTGTNTDNGALAEANETNNVSSVAVTLSRPDLSISAPTLGTVVANANGSWTIPVTFTVTNIGAVAATPTWYDMGYLSTDGVLDNTDQASYFGTRSTALAAGASYTLTASFTTAVTAAPGNYTFFVKTDGLSTAYGGTNTDSGRLTETSESNNVSSVAVTLSRPDLSISAPTLGAVVANTNGSWTIPVTYTVTNIGSVAAAPSWYDMGYLSADGVLDNADQASYFSTRSTALAAGASYTLTANFTTAVTAAPGNYTFFVKTDGQSTAYGGTNTDNGRLTETSESNNVGSAPVVLANKLASVTTLTSSVNPVNLAQSTLLTATVIGNTPTGSVTFKDGSINLATVPLSAGVATYSATFTTSGAHSLTAVYSGDSANVASTSAAVTETVTTVTSTTVAMTASPNPATVGQVVTLRATIAGNNATGTVSFRDGSTSLGSAPASGGVATFATVFSAAGSHSLTANYAGDSLNAASTSAPVTQVVSATPPGQVPPPPVSPTPAANYEYDAQGNPTKVVQAPGVSGFGFETKASYDSLSRVKDTTNPKNGITRFEYDGGDRLNKVTDPRLLVTQYPRNGLGDATSLISPDTGTANHTFDEAGNLKTRTDSRGVLATHSYDVLNRLTQSVYSKSGMTSQTFGWTYDQTGAGFSYGVGRLTSTTHPSGSTQYGYDALGRLTTDIQRVDATAGANAAQVVNTVGYEYDAAGNLTRITYPSGAQVSFGYTDGQVSSVSLAKDAGSAAAPLVSGIEFEPFGGVKRWQWHLAGGATQANERLYDLSGRLTRYRLGNVLRDLTYDAADRITGYAHYDATTGAAQASLNQGFGYDENGRLTTVTTATASWTIGYDANGNRTSVTLSGSPSSAYTTAATSNRLNSITNPARSFGYDEAGNTTSDTSGYTSTYDASGRLQTLTKAGTTTTYSYNGLGQRVRKASSTGANTTNIFVYDQSGQLLGEYSNTGAPIREYVWFGSTPIALFTPNGSSNPTVYYFHTDHLNTPRAATDTADNLRWRWMAEPFGSTAPENNPSNLGALTQNLRFPGQYADSESGLFYNYFRDYDSTTGRYAQSDPIGLAGGINTYAYVGANPISLVDPNGLLAGDIARYLVPAAGVIGTGLATVTAPAWAVPVAIGTAVVAVGAAVYMTLPSDAAPAPAAPPVPAPQGDEFARQTEYLRYKHTCDRPPPPTGDRCEDKRREIEWLKSCRDLRKQWDDRYWPGGHAKNIRDLDKAIKDKERIYKNSWDCHNRPPSNCN